MPILLYAMESININNYQLKLINSWWNSVYRKIFSFQKWESVKLLICLLNRLDLVHLVNLKQIMFIKRMSLNSSNNNIVKNVFNFFSLRGGI